MGGPPSVLMPWHEFMPPYKIVPDSTPDMQQFARFGMLAGTEVRHVILAPHVEAEYFIRDGFYDGDNFVHAALLQKHGPLRVVTVGLTDKIVGFTRRHYTWVDKAHHGHGLSAEMIASVFLATGREKWLDSVYVRKKKPEPFNKAGYASQKKAYRLLVERGFIDPGAESRSDLFRGDVGRV